MKSLSITLSVLCALGISAAVYTVRAQGPAAGLQRIATESLRDLREWDAVVDRMERAGELRLRRRTQDPLLESRTHDRFDQFYKGVRVWGGDLTRQMDKNVTVSIFGALYQGIDLDPTPSLSAASAREAMERLAGVDLPDDYEPELVVLPKVKGGYALSYRGRAFGTAGLLVYFIDARSGDLLLTMNDMKSQAAVGIGGGVLGDNKKLSVFKNGARYVAEDELRPPLLVTFDMKGNVGRMLQILNGRGTIGASDLASDTDNTWTDPATVDAHAYSGWVYDYYFKRFGRRGLDNADLPVASVVHPASRDAIGSQPPIVIAAFYLNAFYAGGGLMVFGEGLPPNLVDGDGRSWNYTSGALDVFAHELTHGVTDYTSQLIYQDESGALNEAFSDMMGVSAEFFYQPPGSGPMQADYLIAEDVVTPGGIRSLQNPAAFGDPDHYSKRFTGTEDNGGVHTNSLIGGHAFYLAIEGGTNRTSGLSVAGVGGGNREQMEKVFYRAFTQMMPANATFSVARAITIQSARDLYGAESAATRAVTEAWTAVGVQ
jgi:bacillolysin